MTQDKERKNWVTKEIFIFIVPFIAAYMCAVIYEAGYADYFHIPFGLISVSVNNIFLTTRLVLMVATIAFLWIGLYYKILPSAASPVFQGIITFILILALALAFQFGKSEAQKNTEFLVMQSEPEIVVLRVYGDTLVAATFNRNTHELGTGIKILDIHELGDKMFKNETIGPLLVK